MEKHHTFTISQWVEYIQKQHWRSVDITLQRVREVWLKIKANHSPYTITVAGTNGKGSSVRMLESALTQADQKVGLYTSPHLVRYNERFRIGMKECSDDDICSALCEIERVRGDITLTYFEYSTLCALLMFERNKVDVMLLEVGMGGRLDAVNIIDADIAVVTNVSLDHEQWLGSNVEDIGLEKAGVFRKNKVAIYADPAHNKSVELYAKKIGSRFLCAKKDYKIKIDENSPDKTSLLWLGFHEDIPKKWRITDGVSIPFDGEKQIDNTSGVLAVLAMCSASLGLDKSDLLLGLANTKHKGRCELVSLSPEVILDVAHNQASTAQLALFLCSRPKKYTIAIFGLLEDKSLVGIIDNMKYVIDHWVLVTIGGDRGQTSKLLRQKISKLLPEDNISESENAGEAYKEIIKKIGSNDRLVVFGSFHIVGEVISLL